MPSRAHCDTCTHIFSSWVASKVNGKHNQLQNLTHSISFVSINPDFPRLTLRAMLNARLVVMIHAAALIATTISAYLNKTVHNCRNFAEVEGTCPDNVLVSCQRNPHTAEAPGQDHSDTGPDGLARWLAHDKVLNPGPVKDVYWEPNGVCCGCWIDVSSVAPNSGSTTQTWYRGESKRKKVPNGVYVVAILVVVVAAVAFAVHRMGGCHVV